MATSEKRTNRRTEYTSIVTWTVRWIRAGQPRAYADSVYEAEIELDGDWYGKRPDFGEEVIAAKARCLVHEWYPKDNKEWHQPWLDEIIKLGPCLWRVKIIEPYLD